VKRLHNTAGRRPAGARVSGQLGRILSEEHEGIARAIPDDQQP
jgi:hypothetical protein